MIEVRELTKRYNDRTAVDRVSFSVQKGEILGFLGPNGAGKSTTMKILSGFMRASSGIAVVNGFDVRKDTLKAKGSIGYLPENPPVYGAMDVEGYLQFAARVHGLEPKDCKRAVFEAMEKCGLVEVKDRLIQNLSKGFRQRVGLAQAITHKPAVLILDEPTVGLDPRQIIDIRNLIKSFAEEHTVILSTHILPEVQATCSRVVVIDHGKLVAEDTLAGISQRMQGSQRITLLLQRVNADTSTKLQRCQGVSSIVGGERKENGEFSFTVECHKGIDPRAELAELCVKEGLGLVGLSVDHLSLEDAFVRLITSEENTREIRS